MKFHFPTGYHDQRDKANAVISSLPRDSHIILAPSPRLHCPHLHDSRQPGEGSGELLFKLTRRFRSGMNRSIKSSSSLPPGRRLFPQPSVGETKKQFTSVF